jgi:hypothetical protein
MSGDLKGLASFIVGAGRITCTVFPVQLNWPSQALHSGPPQSTCVQIPLRRVSHLCHNISSAGTIIYKLREILLRWLHTTCCMLVFNFQLQRSGHEITEALNSASTVVATWLQLTSTPIPELAAAYTHRVFN